jgi:adenine-specific DNA-methyltransferase
VAMEKPVTWLLLTNFAQLHLIRVNEEAPTFSFKLQELETRADEIWELLGRDRLEAGRIEELYDQEQKADLDERFLVDLKQWRLILANGFSVENPKASLSDLTSASQQLLDRFLFCRMLETHGLIEYNKLARAFVGYEQFFSRSPKTFAEFLRESLFEEIRAQFNTELFVQPQLCDTLKIDNAFLAAIIGHTPLPQDVAQTCGISQGQGELFTFRHLYSYDFSRMSHDIMGAVYERFLAHKLEEKNGRITIEETDALRKKEGIYYTPRYIVDYIIAHTLGEKTKIIGDAAIALLQEKKYRQAHAKIRELAQIKVLDPATGSGSFLLRAFDHLVDCYTRYNRACREIKQTGRIRETPGELFGESYEVAEEVINPGFIVPIENIFGVDVDPQAVELGRLNLWMRLMIAERDKMREELRTRKANGALSLLPSLAKNLKRGNSLISDAAVAGDAAFDWQKEFPEIMTRGGFDVVVGNPPYGAELDEATKSFLTLNYTCQSYQLDSYLLFLERSIKDLLLPGGLFGMIIPNPWLTNVLQRDTRRFVTQKTRIHEIVHFLFPVFRSVTVDTQIVLLENAEPNDNVIHVTIAETLESFQQFQIGKGIIRIEHQQANWQRLDGGVINIFLTADGAELATKLASKGVNAESLFEINVGVKPYQVGKGTPPQTQKIVDERSFDNTKKLDKSYRLYLRGGDIARYSIAPLEDRFIKYGPWLAEPRPAADFDAPIKIFMRQTGDSLVAALDEERRLCLNNMHVLVPKDEKTNPKYALGLLNSKTLNWYYQSLNPEVGEALAEVKRTNVAALPIKPIDTKNKTDVKLEKEITGCVDAMLTARRRQAALLKALRKKILHTQSRVSSSLGYYLQQDYVAAVIPEILIDDVMRKGFLHKIDIESDDTTLVLSARVSATAKDEPEILPILRMRFAHAPLRQFIYACWQKFLAENARRKRWTTGKQPEEIYRRIVNTEEPLVYFHANPADNLRAINSLLEAVATEAGVSDLAALEAQIKATDERIDTLVYELYGLIEDEIKIVEGAVK